MIRLSFELWNWRYHLDNNCPFHNLREVFQESFVCLTAKKERTSVKRTKEEVLQQLLRALLLSVLPAMVRLLVTRDPLSSNLMIFFYIFLFAKKWRRNWGIAIFIDYLVHKLSPRFVFSFLNGYNVHWMEDLFLWSGLENECIERLKRNMYVEKEQWFVKLGFLFWLFTTYYCIEEFLSLIIRHRACFFLPSLWKLSV